MEYSLLFKRCLFLVGILIYLTSCKEDYNLTTGNVIGNVRPEGVKIIFDRGDKKFSTVSGVNGKFIMQNLEAGTYTVTYEKEGYFSYKEFGFRFFGGPSEPHLDGPGGLKLKYTSTMTIESVTKGSSYWLSINGKYQKNDDDDDPHYMMYLDVQWFISDKKGVSPLNYKLARTTTSYKVIDGSFSAGFTLKKEDFGNVADVYIIGYVKPGGYSYFDWEKGRTIFAIGDKPSNEWKYTLPSDFFN